KFLYFSPLLKSLTNRDVVEDDYEGREVFIEHLESRFLFLAADARSTLSEAKGSVPFIAENFTSSDTPDSLEFGLDQWKTGALAALKAGAGELRSMLFKGGGMLTLAKIYQLLAKRLSGKMLLEAANYQIRREVLKKAGQLAAINLESRAALLAARQGFGYATSRYLGLRSMMTLFGPIEELGFILVAAFANSRDMDFCYTCKHITVAMTIWAGISLNGILHSLSMTTPYILIKD
ncbi:hypothetical protein ACLOJK_025533, partial [Asimina triloba]